MSAPGDAPIAPEVLAAHAAGGAAEAPCATDAAGSGAGSAGSDAGPAGSDASSGCGGPEDPRASGATARRRLLGLGALLAVVTGVWLTRPTPRDTLEAGYRDHLAARADGAPRQLVVFGDPKV